MAESSLLYYITDRRAFAVDEPARRRHLLQKIGEAARAGIDYIQLREKDLATRQLEFLARESVGILNQLRAEKRELRTKLLINSRSDVALAIAADGVHLRSDDMAAEQVREIWSRAAAPPNRGSPLIGVSCHSIKEIAQAEAQGATFAVFAPVFEKPVFEKKDLPELRPAGLIELREVSKAEIPVLALGGVTLGNARQCLDAGAAGIAAIRLFQENDIATVVAQLRASR
jgi:thiamine-phosphate pyrophosphorylase